MSSNPNSLRNKIQKIINLPDKTIGQGFKSRTLYNDKMADQILSLVAEHLLNKPITTGSNVDVWASEDWWNGYQKALKDVKESLGKDE